MTLNSHKIPGDQKKKNTVKNREICKLLKWQKNILWRTSFIYFFFSLSFTTVRGSRSLNLSFLCCWTGSFGEFSSHLESEISAEMGSFPNSYSSSSTFPMFKQEAQHHFYKCWECRISLTTFFLIPMVHLTRNCVTTQSNQQGFTWT